MPQRAFKKGWLDLRLQQLQLGTGFLLDKLQSQPGLGTPELVDLDEDAYSGGQVDHRKQYRIENCCQHLPGGCRTGIRQRRKISVNEPITQIEADGKTTNQRKAIA